MATLSQNMHDIIPRTNEKIEQRVFQIASFVEFNENVESRINVVLVILYFIILTFFFYR